MNNPSSETDFEVKDITFILICSLYIVCIHGNHTYPIHMYNYYVIDKSFSFRMRQKEVKMQKLPDVNESVLTIKSSAVQHC